MSENKTENPTISRWILLAYSIIVFASPFLINVINAQLILRGRGILNHFYILIFLYPILLLLIDKSYKDKPAVLIAKIALLLVMFWGNLMAFFYLPRFVMIPLDGGEPMSLIYGIMAVWFVMLIILGYITAVIISKAFITLAGRPLNNSALFKFAAIAFFVFVYFGRHLPFVNSEYKWARTHYPNQINQIVETAIRKNDDSECKAIVNMFQKRGVFYGETDTRPNTMERHYKQRISYHHSYASMMYHSCVAATRAINQHDYKYCKLPIGTREIWTYGKPDRFSETERYLGEYGRLAIENECRKVYLKHYPSEDIEPINFDKVCENMLQQFDDAVAGDGYIRGTKFDHDVLGNLLGYKCSKAHRNNRCEEYEVYFLGKQSIGILRWDGYDMSHSDDDMGKLHSINIKGANIPDERGRHFFGSHAIFDEDERDAVYTACPTIDWNERETRIQKLKSETTKKGYSTYPDLPNADAEWLTFLCDRKKYNFTSCETIKHEEIPCDSIVSLMNQLGFDSAKASRNIAYYGLNHCVIRTEKIGLDHTQFKNVLHFTGQRNPRVSKGWVYFFGIDEEQMKRLKH